MYRRNTVMVLVCLGLLLASFATGQAYTIKQAVAEPGQNDLLAPHAEVDKSDSDISLASTDQKPKTKRTRRVIRKVYHRRIMKVKPRSWAAWDPSRGYQTRPAAILPGYGSSRWEAGAEVMFARAKGKVTHVTDRLGGGFAANERTEVDLNDQLKVPEHPVIGTYWMAYRFNPKWALRYQVTPFEITGNGYANSRFSFGTNTNTFGSGQEVQVKWERNYHRLGLAYDPIRSQRARVTVVGEFVKLDDKLSLVQVGCCSDRFDSDLNMGLFGLEFERALKTGKYCNTLSLECKAAVAFGDEAFGSDLSSGLNYKISLNSGRWGYVKGGYRFVSYKKNYNDYKKWDTALEGGFLQMGLIF
jgi:hypothetical protein